MNFAITICSTEKYAYAMTAQARRAQGACSHILEGDIIIAGDTSAKIQKVLQLYAEIMPRWKIHHVHVPGLDDSKKNYQDEAQLIIGKLRTAAFTKARALDVDQCLSLDSDVLPPINGVKCMQQMLEFDDGYYSISTCPYPSQGGGGFLGGRGTPREPILPDWYEDEREIPEEFAKNLKNAREDMKNMGPPKSPEEMRKIDELGKKLHEMHEEIKKFPPKGNVFENNAKRWRPRGWLDQAYPAIGKGAVLPSDWCGFGCTLMNKKALAAAQFDGYPLKGTEDLYIVWWRWHQLGLKLNVITHCPADHVIRNPGKPGYYLIQQGYHETEGECVGHLRYRSCPLYNFDPDDKFDEANDGKFVPPQPSEEEKKKEVLAKQAVEEALKKN